MSSGRKSSPWRPNPRHKKILLFIALLAAGVGFFWFFGAFDFYETRPRSDIGKLDIVALAKDKATIAPVIEKFGIQKVMSALVEKSGGGSVFDCHQEAHNIGRVGYEFEKEQAFASCDASCHSGCYHGAMETFLGETGTANLAANIDRVCSTFSTSFGNFECLHGVGHGVLAYVDYDLPEAIKECWKLGSSFAQRSCIGGMFMENILTGQGLGATADVHETEWVNRTDPHYPCNKIDQTYEVQFECYQMQTSWMLYINGYDFNKVAALCAKAPLNMIPVCYKSFGRDAAGHTLRNPVKILDLCDKVPRAHYDQCIVGALNVIVDFWGPGLKNQAAEFCELTPTHGKNTCYSTLAWRLTDVFADPAMQKLRCDEFEEAYRHLCKS